MRSTHLLKPDVQVDKSSCLSVVLRSNVLTGSVTTYARCCSAVGCGNKVIYHSMYLFSK